MKLKKISKHRSLAIVALIVIIAVTATSIYIATRPKIEPSRIVGGYFSARVYKDNVTGSCKNENVRIEIIVTQGYFKHVGDPDNGLIVTLSNPRIGLGPVIASVRGKTDYSNGYVDNWGTWEVPIVGGNRGIRWLLHVPVTEDGRFVEDTSAFLYLWTDNNITSDIDNSKVDPTVYILWDEYDDFGIIMECYGESFPLGGAARLFPIDGD
jgi:hypothetical protein